MFGLPNRLIAGAAVALSALGPPRRRDERLELLRPRARRRARLRDPHRRALRLGGDRARRFHRPPDLRRVPPAAEELRRRRAQRGEPGRRLHGAGRRGDRARLGPRSPAARRSTCASMSPPQASASSARTASAADRSQSPLPYNEGDAPMTTLTLKAAALAALVALPLAAAPAPALAGGQFTISAARRQRRGRYSPCARGSRSSGSPGTSTRTARSPSAARQRRRPPCRTGAAISGSSTQDGRGHTGARSSSTATAIPTGLFQFGRNTPRCRAPGRRPVGLTFQFGF